MWNDKVDHVHARKALQSKCGIQSVGGAVASSPAGLRTNLLRCLFGPLPAPPPPSPDPEWYGTRTTQHLSAPPFPPPPPVPPHPFAEDAPLPLPIFSRAAPTCLWKTRSNSRSAAASAS